MEERFRFVSVDDHMSYLLHAVDVWSSRVKQVVIVVPDDPDLWFPHPNVKKWDPMWLVPSVSTALFFLYIPREIFPLAVHDNIQALWVAPTVWKWSEWRQLKSIWPQAVPTIDHSRAPHSHIEVVALDDATPLLKAIVCHVWRRVMLDPHAIQVVITSNVETWQQLMHQRTWNVNMAIYHTSLHHKIQDLMCQRKLHVLVLTDFRDLRYLSLEPNDCVHWPTGDDVWELGHPISNHAVSYVVFNAATKLSMVYPTQSSLSFDQSLEWNQKERITLQPQRPWQPPVDSQLKRIEQMSLLTQVESFQRWCKVARKVGQLSTDQEYPSLTWNYMAQTYPELDVLYRELTYSHPLWRMCACRGASWQSVKDVPFDQHGPWQRALATWMSFESQSPLDLMTQLRSITYHMSNNPIWMSIFGTALWSQFDPRGYREAERQALTLCFGALEYPHVWSSWLPVELHVGLQYWSGQPVVSASGQPLVNAMFLSLLMRWVQSNPIQAYSELLSIRDWTPYTKRADDTLMRSVASSNAFSDEWQAFVWFTRDEKKLWMTELPRYKTMPWQPFVSYETRCLWEQWQAARARWIESSRDQWVPYVSYVVETTWPDLQTLWGS